MTSTQAPETRRYKTRAASTDTFGRVLVSARDQHLIVDGPVQNGCPGEAITPAELFLSGVAACGVELIQVLARQQNVPLRSINARIEATQDPTAPVRSVLPSIMQASSSISPSRFGQPPRPTVRPPSH